MRTLTQVKEIIENEINLCMTDADDHMKRQFAEIKGKLRKAKTIDAARTIGENAGIDCSDVADDW
jgi:hypothetical protein